MKRGAWKGIWGDEGIPLELEAISFNTFKKRKTFWTFQWHMIQLGTCKRWVGTLLRSHSFEMSVLFILKNLGQNRDIFLLAKNFSKMSNFWKYIFRDMPQFWNLILSKSSFSMELEFHELECLENFQVELEFVPWTWVPWTWVPQFLFFIFF